MFPPNLYFAPLTFLHICREKTIKHLLLQRKEKSYKETTIHFKGQFSRLKSKTNNPHLLNLPLFSFKKEEKKKSKRYSYPLVIFKSFFVFLKYIVRLVVYFFNGVYISRQDSNLWPLLLCKRSILKKPTELREIPKTTISSFSFNKQNRDLNYPTSVPMYLCHFL